MVFHRDCFILIILFFSFVNISFGSEFNDSLDSNKEKIVCNVTPVSWSQLPGWYGDDFLSVWDVFLRNCRFINKSEDYLGIHKSVSSLVWKPVCEAAFNFNNSTAIKDSNNIRMFLQEHLVPWSCIDQNKKMINGLMTGYYEPLLKGSRHRIGNYQWPIFGVPSDLITVDLGLFYPELEGKIIRGKIVNKRLIPYDSRELIESRIDELPVIVWVDDPVDSVLIGIQGSGRVWLQEEGENGNMIHLGYSASNGHAFASIGSWLLKNEGVNPSLRSIREWARSNPSKVRMLINKNPLVVFFNERNVINSNLGPIGSYGLELTPMRSIAVDSKFIPLGTPVFISSQSTKSDFVLSRIMFAQDTGSLIKGINRADFFWGSGIDADKHANVTNHSYNIWVLWPKQSGAPSLS